jgi:hypothetical protein
MVGAQRERARLCSVDTLSLALRVTDLEPARAVSVGGPRGDERRGTSVASPTASLGLGRYQGFLAFRTLTMVRFSSSGSKEPSFL